MQHVTIAKSSVLHFMQRFRFGLSLKLSLAFGFAAVVFGLALIPALGQFDRVRRMQTDSQNRATGVRALLEMNVSGRDEALAVSSLLLQGNGGDGSPILTFEKAAANKKVWREAARALAQTDQEKAWFAQLDDADHAFEDTFANQLVPAIRNNNRSDAAAASVLTDSYLNRIQHLSEQIIDSYAGSEEAATQTLDATATSTYFQLAIFTVAGVLLHIIFIILITRNILRPLKALRAGTRHVAEGNLTITPPVLTNDEVGDLARDFATMIGGLRQIVGQVQRQVSQIESAARAITRASQDQASGSNQQIGAVQTIADAVLQLSAKASEIANAAERVAQTAQDAEAGTQIGLAAVAAVGAELNTIRERATETMDRTLAVNTSLQEVSQILTAINEIAQETHLLGVNATIEASGSGAHGKRFAVIAREVSALSDRSKNASVLAGRIIYQLRQTGAASVEAAQANLREIAHGTALAEKNAHAVADIAALTDQLAHLSQAIRSTTQAQRDAARQTVTIAQEIGQVARATAHQSVDNAHAALHLQNVAAQLHASTDAFHLEMPTGPEPPNYSGMGLGQLHSVERLLAGVEEPVLV